MPDMEETMQDDHATAATGAHAPAGRPASERRKLFVMRSGARLFAVHADAVEATSENLTPTPLPFAPAPVRGLVSQRGRILTVIDPLLLLPSGAHATHTTPDAPPPASPPTRASAPLTPARIVARIVALKGDEQLALAVERIEPDLELFDDGDEAATTTRAAPNSHPCVRRTIQHPTGAIVLLDTAHLFEAAMQGVERRRRRQ
ncbi:MAG TPA: chemotaxis protein CheW [Pyrinomonadaceae bacterium]|nr:chemotaxis protein CheW [Pyrinomonadaceae bacterium]